MDTGLPSTNNIWLISLIGGISLTIIGFTRFDKHIQQYKNVYQDNRVLNYELNLNSKLLNKTKENHDSIRKILTKKIVNHEQLILVNDLLKENDSITLLYDKTKVELDKKYFLINLNLDKANSDSRDEILLSWILISSGFILFFMGFYKVYVLQTYTDQILFNEFINLKVKYPECQSCGIVLEYDNNFDNNSNYCSNCYKDNKFTIENVSLNEFKEIIEKQLTEKKFKQKEKKEILKKIDSLNRWKKNNFWQV